MTDHGLHASATLSLAGDPVSEFRLAAAIQELAMRLEALRAFYTHDGVRWARRVLPGLSIEHALASITNCHEPFSGVSPGIPPLAAFVIEGSQVTIHCHPLLAGRLGSLDEFATDLSALYQEVPRIPVPGVANSNDAPATTGQTQLWCIDRLTHGDVAYNTAMGFDLTGPLNTKALASALVALADRHDALRASFRQQDGRPYQHFADRGQGILQSTVAIDDRDRFCREEASRSFDLINGPLFRATLCRLNNNQHTLVLCAHHAIIDGWSWGIILAELSALYYGQLHGTHAPADPPAMSFADFSTWQTQWLDTADAQKTIGEWADLCRGFPPALALIGDAPDRAAGSTAGADAELLIDAKTSECVDHIARRSGATYTAVFLCALAVVLCRFADEDKLIIGMPFANRQFPQAEGLVGYLSNVLPLPINLSDDPSFALLLQRTTALLLDALSNQHIPLQPVIERVNPPRVPGRSPLYQVLFTVQHEPFTPMPLDGLQVRYRHADTPTAQFELIVKVTRMHGTYLVSIRYQIARFDHAWVKGFLSCLQNVIGDAALSPQTPVGLLNCETR